MAVASTCGPHSRLRTARGTSNADRSSSFPRSITTSQLEHSHHPVGDAISQSLPAEDSAGDEAIEDEGPAVEHAEPVRPAKRPRSASIGTIAQISAPPAAARQSVRDQSATICELFASLSPAPVLTALASVMVAAGMPDRGSALFENYDQDDLAAFIAELGPSVSPVARILCLSRIANERARRAALSI